MRCLRVAVPRSVYSCDASQMTSTLSRDVQSMEITVYYIIPELHDEQKSLLRESLCIALRPLPSLFPLYSLVSIVPGAKALSRPLQCKSVRVLRGCNSAGRRKFETRLWALCFASYFPRFTEKPQKSELWQLISRSTRFNINIVLSSNYQCVNQIILSTKSANIAAKFVNML